jgi:FtsH-binding integral membrane protein
MQEDHEEKVGLVNSDPAGPIQVQNIDLLAPGQLSPAPVDEPYAAWDAEPEPTGLKD